MSDRNNRYQPSEEWLLRMAELEDGGCTSVGGLAHDLGMLGKEPPRLTDAEEAEAQRLYQEFLDDVATGNAWGMDPRKDV